MEQERLRKHVRILAEDLGERNFAHYQNLEGAAEYIKEELRGYGYDINEQVYRIENRPYRNIIATKRGAGEKEKTVVVCAHYDSVYGSKGADDNASGVAGLLELARLLWADNLNKTVQFIAFTNEEPPFFTKQDMGSFRFARQARKNRQDIEAVLCLESIGFYTHKTKSQSYPVGLSPFYPDKGNFISVVSNLGSRNLLKKVVKDFKKKSDFPLEYLIAPVFFASAISFSDNWSFWKFGYKAVMVTDTAFYRNPYYHTQGDTFEKLDYQSMSWVVEGLYQALLNLSR